MSYRRRDFLKIASAAALMCPALRPGKSRAREGAPRPAAYWRKEGEKDIRCGLCPRGCLIVEGGRGRCQGRKNLNGELFTLVYGNPCSLNSDPIEKKPLFHVLPGATAYSIAETGCNIECLFCQNWEISQFRSDQVETVDMSPDIVVKEALRRKAEAIAFTYSEPTVWFEYMRDICLAARGTPLKKVLISNGYIQKAPQLELLKLLDAVKIDFKAFSESFYKDICSGRLKPVLESLKRVKGEGVWLEMVMLTVPTLNDSERELSAMTKWIVQKLGPDVPIHFTRFYPMYKLRNLPPTPIKTLERSRRIALESGIHFAYAGNVPGHPGENTFCPSCKAALIVRDGYIVTQNNIKNGRCGRCNAEIPGVWK